MQKTTKILLLSCLMLWCMMGYAQIPPPCPSNTTTPADQCANACIYCDFNGLLSTTTGYTAGAATGFCGTIENDQWLGFIAGASSGTFTITPQGCSVGVEAAVYQSCIGTAPIACSTGGNTSFDLIVTNLTPGTNYFLMIDGKNGDECVFTVTTTPFASAPALTPTLTISGSSAVCPGGSGNYSVPAVVGASYYIWDGPPGSTLNGAPPPVTLDANAGGNAVSVVFSNLAAGTASICVQPINSCNDGTVMCKNVLMQSIPPTVFPNITVCAEDLPYITPWGDEVNSTGNYTKKLTTAQGCDSIVKQFVSIRQLVCIFFPPVYLSCAQDTFFVCGVPYTQSGNYYQTCTDVNGCDSTVYFIIIQGIPPGMQIAQNAWQTHPDSIITTCQSTELVVDFGNAAQQSGAQNPPAGQGIWLNASGGTIGTYHRHVVTTSGWYYFHWKAAGAASIPNCSGFQDSVYVQLGTALTPVFQAKIDSVLCDVGQTILEASSLAPNLQFQWSGAVGTATGTTWTVGPPGTYHVYARDTVTGCATSSAEVHVQYPGSSITYGTVRQDQSLVCNPSNATPLLLNTNVVAKSLTAGTPDKIFPINQGHFSVHLPRGEYEIHGLYPFEACNPPHVSIDYCAQVQAQAVDLLLKGDFDCPNIYVSMLPWSLRRCLPGSYYLWYRNTGTPANNAYVEVALDSFLTFTSATPPPTSVSGQLLRWDIGLLSAQGSGFIKINFDASCDVPLGFEHCTEAHIFPDTACTQWQGAIIKLDAYCVGDSIDFLVTNTGTGNMQQALPWDLNAMNSTADQTGMLQLNAGQTWTKRIHADSQPWQFTIDQVPNYPLNSQQSVRVVGCGGNLPTITSNNAISRGATFTSCRANTGSFDPNDKRGLPEGEGADHFIAEGSNISYVIRFQNTGTDTAFTVVVRDTLSPLLNAFSVRPGASSHPYTWKIDTGNVLEFRFNNIMLPDSNINEARSHGAVEFTIDQTRDNAFLAKIENIAAIYFDNNAPVITNTTLHTNGIPMQPVSTQQPSKYESPLVVTPNPAGGLVRVTWPTQERSPVAWVLRDVNQRIVLRGNGDTLPISFDVAHLPAGVYAIDVQLVEMYQGARSVLVIQR